MDGKACVSMYAYVDHLPPGADGACAIRTCIAHAIARYMPCSDVFTVMYSIKTAEFIIGW